MGIVASASKGIQEAISRLRSGQPAEIDGAVARLSLVGRRAVTPLAEALPSLPPAGRVAALEVLERIGDVRALEAVLGHLDDPEPAVSARAATTAVLLGGPHASGTLVVHLRGRRQSSALAAATALGLLAADGHVPSLDALLATAVDELQDDERRLAALDAAAPGAGHDFRAVLLRLTGSPSPRIAADAASRLAFRDPSSAHRATRGASDSRDLSRAHELADGALAAARRADTRRRWLQAIEAEGPGILDALHDALRSASATDATILLAEATGRLARAASIPVLRDLLARLDDAPENLRAAAAVHAALARLDSRVALTDLRDRLEHATGPTAADLVRSSGLVGDPSFGACLASLALRERDLESSCAAAFRAIALRHDITRRSRPVTALAPTLRAAVAEWLPATARARRR